MATVSTTAIASAAPSATGLEQRSVADVIRRLFPSNTLSALVQTGLGSADDFSKKSGLIKKRQVEQTRYECFTYTPLAITVTVASWSSITSFTVSSADGLTLGMCLMNTRTRAVAKIYAISSTTLSCVAVGTTNTFTAAEADVLLLLAPAYKEGSTSPYLLTKDDDNVYNTLQIVRFAVQITKSAQNTNYYGGDLWKRMNEKNVLEGLRKVDNTLIWGQRAESGNTTTDSTLGNMRTTRGLANWAAVSKDAGGALTFETFMSDIMLAMSDTVGQESDLIGFCGKYVNAEMVKWQNANLLVTQTPELKKYGMKTNRYVTAGPNVEMMLHDSFDRGQLNKLMLFTDPGTLEYVYLKNRDLHPEKGNQAPDADYVQNEIIGEIGLSCLDGGTATTLVTNCGNWA